MDPCRRELCPLISFLCGEAPMSIAAQMEVFKGASTALRVKAWGVSLLGQRQHRQQEHSQRLSRSKP